MIWQDIINFILPARCCNCDCILDDGAKICQDCFNKITFIAEPYCKKCGLPFENKLSSKGNLCGNCLKDNKAAFRFCRSALKYDDFSKKMLLDFKFFDKTQNAILFALWLQKAGKDIFEEDVDLIIPVPLHFSRIFQRKYNQSALLAHQLSKLIGVKADCFSLIRRKKTKPQVEFSGKARLTNVKDAFEVKKPENIKGKKILLIDDVMTTGSTLKECAKALKKSGAASVDYLSVART